MAYDLKHTGEAVDAAVSAVESGKVVTDNTVSSIAPGGAKPASADAIAKALQEKVDKVVGKGLSTNDYTNEDKAEVNRLSPPFIEIGSYNSLYPTAGMRVEKKDNISRAIFNRPIELPAYISLKDGYKVYHNIYCDKAGVATGVNGGVAEAQSVFIPKDEGKTHVLLVLSYSGGTITTTDIVDSIFEGNSLCKEPIQYSGKLLYGSIATASGATLFGTSRITPFFDVSKSVSISANVDVAQVQKVTMVEFRDDTQLNNIQSINNSNGVCDFTISKGTRYVRLSLNPQADNIIDSLSLTCMNYGRNAQEIDKEVHISVSEANRRISYIPFKFRLANKDALNVLSENVSVAEKYSGVERYSAGFVYLPDNYTPDGESIRLIIFAQGSGRVMTNDFSDTYKPIVEYLCAEGYAVACCTYMLGCESDFGYNSDYANDFWGSPTNYAVYNAFYAELMKKYNFKREVLLFGKSQGGLQVMSLPYCTSIPVLAACNLAGEDSPLNNLFGYNNAQRVLTMADFGFEGLNGGEADVMLSPDDSKEYAWTAERQAYLLSQADKLRGYLVGTIHSNMTVEDYISHYRVDNDEEWLGKQPRMENAVPTLIVVAKDDRSIYRSCNRAFHLLSNGNNVCRMRLMPSGAANPHQAVDALAPKIQVSTLLGGEMSVAVDIVEMLEFFKHWEN